MKFEIVEQVERLFQNLRGQSSGEKNRVRPKRKRVPKISRLQSEM